MAISASHLKAFASVLALLPALGVTADHVHATEAMAGRGDAASCGALLGKVIVPGTVVTSAEFAPDGRTVGATKVAAPFCRVVGVATPSADSRVGFEMWLPPAPAWNGKLEGVGSGASAGTISTGALATALAAGYAGMATDNGHVTDTTQKNGSNEQTWALGHPEKMIDFAWRAEHVSTVAAKAVVRLFYGHGAQFSYFVGCSQGGHHALMEASRFPEDYDGIVAGAPAWHWANQMVNGVWGAQAALRDASAITEQSSAILNRAVLKACDKLDGLEDGVIADPRRCTFDPVTIQCGAGAATGECLTPVQVAAAQRLYAGATRSDGSRIFQGLPRGGELNWWRVWGGDTPGGSSFDFWRYSVFQDRNFRNVDFDFDRDAERGLNTRVLGQSVADTYNVPADLHRFRARGGKLIMFHGWADQQVTPFASLDFYRRIAAKEGQSGIDSFLRLFFLAGINHCQGGPGAGNIGGSSAALSHDPEHDLVAELDAWVTRKKAPDMLIGAHLDGAQHSDRTRPLCRFPLEAQYKGAGDSNDAASFACAPVKEPLPR